MIALVALMMGFAYVAPPGPVNVETIRRGIAGGFRPAVCVQLGALTGDILYAAVALLGLGSLLPHAVLQMGLAPLGGTFLLYLGVGSLRNGVGGLRLGERHAVAAAAAHTQSHNRSLLRSLLAGAVISMASPFGLAFWLSLGSTILLDAHQNMPAFLAGYFAGVLAWAVALPALLWWCRAVLQGSAFHYLSIACGLALIGFGASVDLTMLTTLFR